MPMTPTICITRAVPGDPHAAAAAGALASGGGPPPSLRIGPAHALPRPELLRFIAGADGLVTMFHDRIDAEYLDAAGPQLKGLCTFAVGTDNIDLDLCRHRRLVVCSTPDVVTEGTANMAFGLLLSVARSIPEADKFVRSGRFAAEGNGFPHGWMGAHLHGQLLLIVGAGRIGLAVAKRAVACGMTIAYVARSQHPEFETPAIGARRTDLDTGLAQADVVSIHTPLSPQTTHLLDRRRLALLKSTAIVINTARGPVIDEAALVEALASKAIYGAGLDVFEREPELTPGLANLPNVVLTPHIGSSERYWREKMTDLAVTSMVQVLRGQRPPNAVV